MKKLAIALGAFAVLWVGMNTSAETINYTVTGWQATCTQSTFTGVEGPPRDCLNKMGVPQGSLSQGTITGTAQFIGDSVTGGTLTVISNTFVQDVTSSSATISSISWTDLAQNGDPAGLTVTASDSQLTGCVGADSICSATTNTPIPVANIDLYGPGVTVGGTLSYIVKAASAGGLVAWQGYTLTVDSVVPEPSTALLWGAAMAGLALSGWMRKR